MIKKIALIWHVFFLNHCSLLTPPTSSSRALIALGSSGSASVIVPALVPSSSKQLQMKYDIAPRPLDKSAINEIERILGYKFKDRSLLVQALTTREKNPEKNYETLEFLGDSILDAIVVEMLFLHYPQANEGMLHEAKVSLVSQEPIASLCLHLGLHNYIQHISHEIKISHLCDLIESVTAAIYLDGGPNPTQDFVLRFFTPMIKDKPCPILHSRIIQIAAKELNQDVDYFFDEESNCYVGVGAGTGIVTKDYIAKSKSKGSLLRLSLLLKERQYILNHLPQVYKNALVRFATDLDYKRLLDCERLLEASSFNLSWVEGITSNSCERLHTLMQKLNTELPIYHLEDETSSCESRFVCSFGNPIFADIIGYATKKSLAREKVANIAYQRMQKSIILSQDLGQITDTDTVLDAKNPISYLNEFCHSHNLDMPTYSSFYKSKRGNKAISTKLNAPWLFAEIKGASADTVDLAKTQSAKRVVALMQYLSTNHFDPKKLDLFVRYKKEKPLNFLIYCCKCLELKAPNLETNFCEGPVSEGLKFQSSITLDDFDQKSKKQIFGIKALSKSIAEVDVAKKTSEYLINKLIAREIK